MRRLFWLSLGVGVGFLVGAAVVRRVEEAKRAVAPDRLAGRAGHAAGTLVARFREALEEGRAVAAAKERELREAYDIPSVWDALEGRL